MKYQNTVLVSNKDVMEELANLAEEGWIVWQVDEMIDGDRRYYARRELGE